MTNRRGGIPFNFSNSLRWVMDKYRFSNYYSSLNITGIRILVTNKPLKTTSTIDKDIMLNNSPMKFNVPGKLVVPRINRNNEVENTGYMLNELMKAKVNRLRLSVRSYINPTEQNKPLELKP